MIGDIIAIIIILLIVGGAVTYIIKEKKKGKRCLGCPYGDTCSKKGCESQSEKTEK